MDNGDSDLGCSLKSSSFHSVPFSIQRFSNTFDTVLTNRSKSGRCICNMSRSFK
jgi:hypothetical protein